MIRENVLVERVDEAIASDSGETRDGVLQLWGRGRQALRWGAPTLRAAPAKLARGCGNLCGTGTEEFADTSVQSMVTMQRTPDPRSPRAPHNARHHPPHQVDRGLAVFVTATTVRRAPHLRSPVRKDGFLEEMRALAAAHAVELVAWVVLDEHYHAVIRPTALENFNRWLGTLHSRTALRWNQEDGCARRQVWQNYWDKTLWTEGDLWTRINYVHRNPVKHGYTEDPATWPWSSLNAPEFRWDADETRELIRRFPAPLRLPDDD